MMLLSTSGMGFFFLLQNSNKLAFASNWGRIVPWVPLPIKMSIAEKRPKRKCIPRRKTRNSIAKPKKQPFFHFCELISWQQRVWLNYGSLYCLWEFSLFICLISLVSESRVGTLGSVSHTRKSQDSQEKGRVALREKVLYLNLVLVLEGFGCSLEARMAQPVALLKLSDWTPGSRAARDQDFADSRFSGLHVCIYRGTREKILVNVRKG